MKNIHVLPTDKPSRLFYDKILQILETPYLMKYSQNIYITNDEKIKDGDWYYLPRTNSVHKCKEDPTELNLERKLGVVKIILTTDTDLIKDGVQAIDDEFLEWFVKNPSCEKVEVKHYNNQCRGECGICDNTCGNWYKIIIPKEQQKQHLIDMMRSDEELGLYDEQETLDEVSEKESEYLADLEDKDMYKKGFIDGAKWQQQQNKNLYSEEDLEQAHFEGKLKKQSFKEWFEQFKKQ